MSYGGCCLAFPAESHLEKMHVRSNLESRNLQREIQVHVRLLSKCVPGPAGIHPWTGQLSLMQGGNSGAEEQGEHAGFSSVQFNFIFIELESDC